MNNHPQNVRKTALLVTNDFPPIISGISTVFYHVWKRLPRNKIMVLAPWTSGCDAFDKKESIPIIRKKIPVDESGKSKIIKMLLNVCYALYYARRYHINKLHCGQIISVGPAGLLGKKLLGVKYSVSVYGSETARFGKNRLTAWLMRKVIQEAEELITNSECTSREFERWGIRREKIVKIVPGVDTTLFCPQKKPPYLVEKYGLRGKQVVLTVGRLDERKGHDMVMRAVRLLTERLPQLTYVIVGNGREEQRLKDLAKDLGINERIIFAGFVTDEALPDYYRLCDVFALPNRETEDNEQMRGDYEGFGIVFLEAGACGKPVIAGKSGGSGEAVVDGVTGLLVDPKSDRKIAHAIERILTDDAFAGQLGTNGRRRTEKEFDWQYAAEIMERIL